jgi:hypothetical protein
METDIKAYLEYLREHQQKEKEKEWARRADTIYRTMTMKMVADKRVENVKKIWK